MIHKLQTVARQTRDDPEGYAVTRLEAYGLSRLRENAQAHMLRHFRALHQYHPGPYPGKLTLLRAQVQPLFGTRSPTLGWELLAQGGVEVHYVPGMHGTILKEPHVRQLARVLGGCMERAVGALMTERD